MLWKQTKDTRWHIKLQNNIHFSCIYTKISVEVFEGLLLKENSDPTSDLSVRTQLGTIESNIILRRENEKVSLLFSVQVAKRI